MPLLLAASLAAAAVEGHFPGAAGGGYPEPWTRDAAINSWNARLTLRLHGEGTHVRSIRMAGRPLPGGRVAADLTGSHTLDIALR